VKASTHPTPTPPSPSCDSCGGGGVCRWICMYNGKLGFWGLGFRV
jgi:hypothetical protein